MTGQANQRLDTSLAQNGGLAGLDGNTMKQQASHRFDDTAGRILHAHAAAAGKQDCITFGNSFRHFFGKQSFIVNDDTIVDDTHAKGHQHSFQHGAVHIPHLSGAGDDFRRNQLIAGGDNANSQLFHHRNLHPANGSQCANILRGQHSSLF